MPELKTYKLFISHSWAYGDAYDKLTSFFDEHPNFKWVNHSIPKNDPVHDADDDAELFEAIKNKMASINCVVMMAGVYSTYSKWINSEIEIAKEVYSKPLVAVEPWASEKTSTVVKDNADEIVKWQSSSIVNAIRNNSI
ncbi:MAG: TIR domain-containing protein [Alphaproteobacteria bacterium]|nr:TIR domain-containing protein [Alphaproteobacteria bacterium]